MTHSTEQTKPLHGTEGKHQPPLLSEPEKSMGRPSQSKAQNVSGGIFKKLVLAPHVWIIKKPLCGSLKAATNIIVASFPSEISKLPGDCISLQC